MIWFLGFLLSRPSFAPSSSESLKIARFFFVGDGEPDFDFDRLLRDDFDAFDLDRLRLLREDFELPLDRLLDPLLERLLERLI
jgi:hypothetical protein